MPLTGNITIGGIEQSKVKIYYSSNANATKDLNNSENGWQETPSNLSNIKSYLVVVQGAVEKSTQLIINYLLELPQNLSYNKNSYLSYKVYNLRFASLPLSQNRVEERPSPLLATHPVRRLAA